MDPGSMNNTTSRIYTDALIENNSSSLGNISLGTRLDQSTNLQLSPLNIFAEYDQLWGNFLVAFCWVIVPILCWMASPSIPDARHRRGAEIRQRARRLHTEQKQRNQVEDPEERERMIKNSLVVKTVMTVDRNGNLSVGDPSSLELAEIGSANQQPTNINDEESSTCAICLEDFQVGDIVSWSRYPPSRCLHVFHDDCITEWLQNPKHDDCPTCRTVILPVEENTEDEEDSPECGALQEENDLDDMPTTGVFTIIHGIVTGARARYSIIEQEAFANPPESEEDMEEII